MWKIISNVQKDGKGHVSTHQTKVTTTEPHMCCVLCKWAW